MSKASARTRTRRRSGRGHTARTWLQILLLALMSGAVAVPAARLARPHQEPAAPDAAYDAAVTDTARVLAGLPPADAARFEAATKRPAWLAYSGDAGQNWSRLKAERFASMRAWADREVATLAGPCDTLFYPFGGPDFINAYVLFPGCNQYLLFGLEPVGSVPDLQRQDPQALDATVAELRASLSDVFVRDYFITREMMTELTTPRVDGTVPLLLVFLARLDARIVDIRMETPWEAAEAAARPAAAPAAGRESAARPPRRPTGVTIRFLAAGSPRVQTLTYARVRMEDAAFPKEAALLAYLHRRAPLTTMLKSASYLLHDDQFSKVRSTVLDLSHAILQDDTGVPYRFFDRTAWQVTLFGRYSPPIKDFNYGRQPDLENAFHDNAGVRELPFSYGYHWREGTSSVLLAVRTGSTR
jgi:hypothetical protein